MLYTELRTFLYFELSFMAPLICISKNDVHSVKSNSEMHDQNKESVSYMVPISLSTILYCVFEYIKMSPTFRVCHP